ncbi:MAG: hypothetical protein WCA81_07990 [Rhizomicrobium sp.]
MNDDLKTLWQNQTTDYAPMPLEEIRKRAGKLHSRVNWRNVIEYAASVVVIAVFGLYLWIFPAPLARLGSVLIIAGTLYMMWQLHRRGATAGLPAEQSASAWTDYYRHELERQRDALRTVWKWYLAPFVPGLIVFLVGRSMEFPDGLIRGSVAAAISISVFAGIWALNAWVARRLQRKIDELKTNG